MKVSSPPSGWTASLVKKSRPGRNAARLFVVLCAVAVLPACSGGGTGVPAAPSINASTAAELSAKALSDVAAAFQIADPPEVAVVTETSPFDVDQTVVDCLKRAGYNASVKYGGVNVDASTGLDSPSDGPSEEWTNQFHLAYYVCRAQYPLDPIYLAPLTPEQKNAQADYFLDELPKCLEGFGIPFDTPPSRDVFLATLDAQGPWSPYGSAQIPGSMNDKVEAACPQTIPPDHLWQEPT